MKEKVINILKRGIILVLNSTLTLVRIQNGVNMEKIKRIKIIYIQEGDDSDIDISPYIWSSPSTFFRRH